MRNSFFLTSCLFISSLSTFAFGAENNSPATQPKMQQQNHLKKPISLYETFDNNGVNIGIRGDVLYMIYNSPALTYASEQSAVSEVLYSKTISVPGKPSVGCDLALTYTMPNDPGYSFETEWFHIVAKFSRNVNSDNIVPAHSVALTNPAPGNASVLAHMSINFFDLVINKQFSFGDWVSFTPTAGVIGGYMEGKSSAHFSATSGAFSIAGIPAGTTRSTEADLSYTNRFGGAGLKLGVYSAFKIWKGLRLEANLFYSALYGLAKAELNYSQNGLYAGIEKGSKANYEQHQGRIFFDSLLGLAWATQFSNDAFFLDFHAGWRFQVFTEGWQGFEAEFNDALQELSLYGQGLQAGITFKF